ncbi:hypothetical protein N7454_001072 [Penicillium verhagenii]|nr:hypothetical protein N7454_001072 [Penicillium verhagenii]
MKNTDQQHQSLPLTPNMSAESPGPKQSGFKAFFSNALRPKKSRQTLRKGSSRSMTDLRLTKSTTSTRPSADGAPPMPDLAPLQAHRLKYQQAHANLDTQLGERSDYTTIIHSIGVLEADDTFRANEIYSEYRKPGDKDIAKLPATRPKTSSTRCNSSSDSTKPSPHHLLCFPCGKYHRRTAEGSERLKPAHIVNPLFDCPESTNSLNPPPRHRITHGRMMPFSFVQLTMRAHRFGPHYGITPDSMARRWSRDGWSHSSRYLIHEGRLLMRVTSQTFAAPDLPPSLVRILLHSREDYWPYFSACAHWRDGELMPACRCALEHIPKPRQTGGLQGVEHKVKDRWTGYRFDPNALTTLCGVCRPMRRCPECPSEYLIEVKRVEDRSDPLRMVFRQAISVTRWTDLGDGTSPKGCQWGSINGVRDDYDAFVHPDYAKRGLASIFEAAFTADTLPGQRILSLNPKKKKLGEKGHDWY